MAADNKRGKRLFFRVLFIAYLILLFYLLFFSEKMGRTAEVQQYRYNLTLFREIRPFISIRKEYPQMFLLNVVGNIAAFMPFGFLLPLLRQKRTGFFLTTLLSFELSLIVELLQLFFKLGCCDVDDLLLNTIGGILGYLAYYIFIGRKNRNVSQKA